MIRCRGLRLGQLIGLAVYVATATTLGAAPQDAGATQTFENANAQVTQRPGLWRLGSLYITPKLRIGTLGLDSNVFYTPTERRADFTASAGPGLELVLPMSSLRLRLEGSADYLYFARTESQRRWGGSGLARLEWKRSRVLADVEEGFTRTFRRPNFEVDRRILQDQWAGHASLTVRIVGGLSVTVEGSRIDNEVKNDAEYRGADLRASLTRDETRVVGEIQQALTAKTSLLAGGDQQADRFPLDETRDADSNRAYSGFEIESRTRLSGRAVAGVRFYRPRDESRGRSIREPYADVALLYRFGPRTYLEARYNRDLVVSAFEFSSRPPTLSQQVYEVRFGKGLPARLDVQVFGGLTLLRSQSPVTVEEASGDTQTAIRDDEVWQGGADLGFRFRSHYRLGVGATYTDRRSTFVDFGIEGLLVGATLKYVP